MVAQKRGRGAKAAAAKKPAAAVVEEPVPEVQEAEMTEAPEAVEDNNGQEEATEEAEADADATMEEAEAEANDNESAENAASAETTESTEAPPEEKKEEKVEPGRLLVENLPSSFLFDYKEKLQELFSKHGEILSIRRGPLVVTELTNTPTLSAIVEFKNKDSLEQALSEGGTEIDGHELATSLEWRPDCSVMVGIPHDVNCDYVRNLLSQCGEVANVTEYSKTKNKILRVTFVDKESVPKAIKVDRELRINGFLVTVNKFQDEDNKPGNPQHKPKRQHPSNNQNNRNSLPSPVNNNANRNNNFRPPPRVPAFNARPNFRGDGFPPGAVRGRGGFPGRGAYGPGPRGGFGLNSPYMPPPQGFMGRPGGFMDGQRPNKRLRPM